MALFMSLHSISIGFRSVLWLGQVCRQPPWCYPVECLDQFMNLFSRLAIQVLRQQSCHKSCCFLHHTSLLDWCFHVSMLFSLHHMQCCVFFPDNSTIISSHFISSVVECQSGLWQTSSMLRRGMASSILSYHGYQACNYAMFWIWLTLQER